MKKLIICLMVVVAMTACGGSPAAPAQTPAPVAACERNNTGTLVITNDSAKLEVVDVYVNGAKVATLAYGAKTSQEVPAGVSQVVKIYYTRTGSLVGTAQPTVARCQNYELSNPFSTAGQ